MSQFPTHLNCPYCPAQAFRNKEPLHVLEGGSVVSVLSQRLALQFYICPAKHEFCVAEVQAQIERTQ